MTTNHPWTPARLVSLRRDLGLSRRQMGDRLGRSWRTIEAWEQGRSPRALRDPLVVRELERLTARTPSR